MYEPWNSWYHCNGNTFGTWLPGDPRGYRTRWHKYHVEGDYHNPPPPGRDRDTYERSKRLMKDAVVSLDVRQRKIVCRELAAKLIEDEIELLVIAVDDHHYHLIGRFPDGRPRHWVGRTKYHSSMVLRGDKPHARVWAHGSRAWPIRDRAHQLNAFEFIVAHRTRGATVWTFRDPVPECTFTAHT